MTHSSTPSTLPESAATSKNEEIAPLVEQLKSGSPKQQFAAIAALQSQGDSGLQVLTDFVRSQTPLALSASAAAAVGKAYQVLIQMPAAQPFLDQELSEGPFIQQSDWTVDYRELQHLLAQGDYESADRLTMQKLCELAGPDAIARKWVYFTETSQMSTPDLLALDRLWRAYSEDRFGFSRQREIWLGVNQNWERLWEKLAWKSGNVWTRYPGEFVWSLAAPLGHLPLSNQLRGVRMIAALFDHPAWSETGTDALN